MHKNITSKKIYVLRTYVGKNNHAGSKCVRDIDCILENYGFINLWNLSLHNDLCKNEKKNVIYYITRFFNCLRTIINIKNCKNQYVFVQYPDYSPAWVKKNIEKFIKRNKSILIIHDIDIWRNMNTFSDEISLLNSAVALIVHNHDMALRLRTEGVKQPYLIELDLFDYILSKNVPHKRFEKSVVFAGNLGKSMFLNDFIKLKRNFLLNIYGDGLKDKENLPGNTVYCGSHNPDELPFVIPGGFGLVWDGDAIDHCGGIMGNYTRWNNPHKLSLYIAAGIPVIVWEQSAIAKFVKKYNIGFCIHNLLEINSIMDSIDVEIYEKMLVNIEPLQQKVIKGKFFENAVDDVLIYLDSM